jgi:hypothetical protein
MTLTPTNKPTFGDKLTEEERLEYSALVFAFRDCFSESKRPGTMRGVEFTIDFKEPFTKSFKEEIRMASP